MELKKLLMISLLSLGLGNGLQADDNGPLPEDKATLCPTEGSCSDLGDGCQCYCSVKCGPRNKKPGDTPRWNQEHNRCMCADRDEELFNENCALLEEEDKKGIDHEEVK